MSKVSVNTITTASVPPDEEGSFVAPPEKETRRLVATPEEVEAQQKREEAAKAEELTVLDEEDLSTFRSLLTIGERIKTMDVMGHEVVFRTLNSEDEMRVGLYTKQYDGSRGLSRAYQVAVLACAIQTVDGIPVYSPLGEESADVVFDKKFKAIQKYYPITVSMIYDAVIAAEVEFVELAKKLGKIPG